MIARGLVVREITVSNNHPDAHLPFLGTVGHESEVQHGAGVVIDTILVAIRPIRVNPLDRLHPFPNAVPHELPARLVAIPVGEVVVKVEVADADDR